MKKFLNSKWARWVGTACGLLIALLVVIWLMGFWPFNARSTAGVVGWDQIWPSQIVGPSCMQIAAERHIPQDLADHTCEAIRE